MTASPFITIRREDLEQLVDLALRDGHQGYDVPTREDIIATLTAAVGRVLPPLTSDRFWDVFAEMADNPDGTIHQIFALELFAALRAAASTEEETS